MGDILQPFKWSLFWGIFIIQLKPLHTITEFRLFFFPRTAAHNGLLLLKNIQHLSCVLHILITSLVITLCLPLFHFCLYDFPQKMSSSPIGRVCCIYSFLHPLYIIYDHLVDNKNSQLYYKLVMCQPYNQVVRGLVLKLHLQSKRDSLASTACLVGLGINKGRGIGDLSRGSSIEYWLKAEILEPEHLGGCSLVPSLPFTTYKLSFSNYVPLHASVFSFRNKDNASNNLRGLMRFNELIYLGQNSSQCLVSTQLA